MKKAPLGLVAYGVVILVVAWLFIWKMIVPAMSEQLKTKDATIQQLQAAKESIGQQKDSTIQAKEAVIQQLQTTLAVNGLNTFPLKKRAITLAEQLDKFAIKVATEASDPAKATSNYTLFDQRFLDHRVPTILYEFDQQGVHADELDYNAPVWQDLRTMPLKPDPIRKLAEKIRSLASQLKD